MARKICIDAGHYGNYNQSPVNKKYYEAVQMWELHLLLKAELETYGFEVITTRADKNKDLDLYARGQKAKGCDLFLSLHSNACGKESVDYPLTIYPISNKGKDLAEKLTKCVAATMATKQAGDSWTKKGNNGDYYGVIRGAVSVGVVGIIIEHGFHTNKKNAEWLLNKSNLEKLAKAEAAVIAEYYGIKKTETKAETKTETKTEKKAETVKTVTLNIKQLERGIYHDKQVQAMQQLLIAKGFDLGISGADGSFGADTEKAVKAYQKSVGIGQDGICGIKTWSKLLGLN